MSAPIFLNVDQFLSILMDELPFGVYPTDLANDPDPDKRSNSSSELRAHAQLLSELSANLQTIYQDKFASTVTPGGIGFWEKNEFRDAQNSALSFDARKARLLAKIRAVAGINLPAIRADVAAILDPLGIAFDILAYSGQSNGSFPGSWVMNISPLGLSTYLAGLDPLEGAKVGFTALDCNLDYAAAGLTAQDLLDIQATAYTYAVMVYGTLDAATLATLDTMLTELEPARSTHLIFNNAPLPPDPSIVDGGDNWGDTLIDSVDFGDFGPAGTYDVWDFNEVSA